MPTNCSVPGCNSTSKIDGVIKFHQFPKDETLKKKWLDAIKRSENELSKRPKVCSKHFTESDYTVTRLNYSMGSKNNPSPSRNTCEWKVVKPNAVPSLNLPGKSTIKIKISKKNNNDQEIKIEEVQLEGEGKVKMPKKHAEVLPRPRTQSRRAASKEALKQMQLLLDDDDDDTVEIPSDDEVIPVEPAPPPPPPPKKKYKLSHRKSSDGHDRDVIVLKSITNRNAENTLELDCWIEQLEEVQKSRIDKMQKEEKQLQEKLESLIKSANAEVIHKGDLNTIIEVTEIVQNTLTAAQAPPSNLILNNSISGTPQSYQLVMDPRLGLIVGAVTSQSATTPTNTPQKVFQGKVTVAQGLQQTPTPSTSQAPTRTVRTRRGAAASKIAPPPPPVVAAPQTRSVIQTRSTPAKVTPQAKPTPPAKATPTTKATPPVKVAAPTKVAPPTKAAPPKKTVVMSAQAPATRSRPPINTYSNVRPSEGNVEGGLATGGGTTAKKAVVDLTSEDGRAVPDSREISFNKLQGKTFPSLVVVARPHLRVVDLGVDRPKLDAKVKSVLMHAPTKFTEWLIQQGLVRSEQKCSVHTTTQLKLGMYSDVSKFPYSGGYVWISECCPQRFVSVFSGSLFEGSPHPPMVILKLLYHWACQTNIQNVTQWVKVDNLYVKGMFTWLRSVCSVALQTHIRQLGGPGIKVEVGVISLGTTSQDGNQRQVKVEVLGILESNSKLIRLRAVEPQADADRNYKKRFSKILEPIYQWVHPQSILVADLTVDKQTLHNMGFTQVLQSMSSEYGSNRQIMEYLRRIVPRMFQNTLSLLSRQIIQQFLDELVWREWFGTSSLQAFDNLVIHLSEQTRYDSGQSLIQRLNKVAQNPFKNWAIPVTNPAKIVENAQKKPRSRAKAEAPKVAQSVTVDVNRPPKSTSPDVPEQMVPLENYYYGTIDHYSKSTKITLNIKCPLCKSLFNNNIQLMNHLFKHAHNVSQDAQLCRYCLTSVPTANDLLKHIATSHPAETKFDNGFVCLICETQYMNPFVLGKHMSKEHCPSELPYQCGTCGYRCSNHKQAIDHFYKQHDSGPTIQCPFCLKSTTVFSSSRNIVQNMNYFIQHLQKHQRKQFARRCGKCNLWFVQKDVLRDHQTRMHASQRGKNGLIPWNAPRNGVMVPKSKMDKYPGDADVINFSTLYFNVSKNLLCKECNTSMDTPKHFPSFESCQNPNCQYSTCCTNAMQEHNAKCSKSYNPVAEEKMPFEMFCICGYSDTDGNQMARHLAICERKSAYPSKNEAKSAIVTHSMLDVLGLVRKPEEGPSGTSKRTGTKQEPVVIEDNEISQSNDVMMNEQEAVGVKKAKKRKYSEMRREESIKIDDEVEEVIEETESAVEETVIEKENEKKTEETKVNVVEDGEVEVVENEKESADDEKNVVENEKLNEVTKDEDKEKVDSEKEGNEKGDEERDKEEISEEIEAVSSSMSADKSVVTEDGKSVVIEGDDKSVVIEDEKSVVIEDDDKSVVIEDDDKSVVIEDEKSVVIEDDKSIVIEDEKSVVIEDDDNETEPIESSSGVVSEQTELTEKSPESTAVEESTRSKDELNDEVASTKSFAESQNEVVESQEATETKSIQNEEDAQGVDAPIAAEAEKVLEVPHEPVGAREQISPVNEMETSEVIQEKTNSLETEITSDDIQNIISDVVGEKSIANMGFDDVEPIEESANMETETDINAFSTQDETSRAVQDVAMQITQDESMEVPCETNEVMECEVTPMETD